MCWIFMKHVLFGKKIKIVLYITPLFKVETNKIFIYYNLTFRGDVGRFIFYIEGDRNFEQRTVILIIQFLIYT